MGPSLPSEALARFIRFTGTARFRGKGRLISHWLRHRPRSRRALRTLPGGARVECDFAFDYDCMVYLRQEEERDLLTLQRMLRPGDTFVDGGANIGLWTLVAAPAVGASGRVVAFEPNPNTAARLRRNVGELNRFGEIVTVIESALGAQPGMAALDRGASHNVARLLASSADGVEVKVATLDELADRPIAGMKLDVEGSEHDALLGATRVLRSRPWLCIEFNTLLAGTQRLGDWPPDRLLRELGYIATPFSCAPNAAPLARDWRTTGYVNLLYRHPESTQ